MPSEKVLQDKQAIVAELTSKLKDSAAGVLVDYKGISVANDTKLRKELREAGVEYRVVKNTLLKFAIDNVGFSALEDQLNGTTAIAVSSADPIAPARILNKYAEDSKGAFTIKAGFMDGAVMSANEVKVIANLPNREGLLSMLCSALSGNIRGLAVALNAIAEKQGA